MTPEPFNGEIVAGGASFRLGGVRLGMFDESSALEVKQRFHELADGTGFSGRIEKTVPFGCEYAVVRTYERFPGVLRVALDVRALHGGAVTECMLDPLEIAGGVVRAGILRDDGATDWLDRAAGDAMPRAVELELADGTFAELQTGDDLWRHRSASASGASSAWEMTLDGGKFAFSRTMVKFPADVPPPSRPWRWEYALVWARPGNAAAVMTDAETVDCAGMCFAAPPVRRKFRDMVRRTNCSLRLVNVAAGVCAEAGHTGRGRELAHQDAGELLALFAWGNRMLAPRGLALAVELTAPAVQARPAFAARLRQPLDIKE